MACHQNRRLGMTLGFAVASLLWIALGAHESDQGVSVVAPERGVMRSTDPVGARTTRGASMVLVDGFVGPGRVDFRLKLRPAREQRSPVVLSISPVDTKKPDSPALARLDIVRPRDPKQGNRKLDGRLLQLVDRTYSTAQQKWQQGETTPLWFWPAQAADGAALLREGYSAQTWHGRFLACRFEVQPREIRFYLEGRLVQRWHHTAVATGMTLVVHLRPGDELANVTTGRMTTRGLFESVDVSGLARKQVNVPVEMPASPIDFIVANEGRAVVDLGAARWIDQPRDPTDLFSKYDDGAEILNDPRMPMLRIPKADYLAAHVVASAPKDLDRTNILTLRVGSFGGRKQVLMRDFNGKVPRLGRDRFVSVRIPMHDAIAQDVLADVLDVELTKQVRLARHVPDPNRFNRRPLGHASGVRLAAITFEKSPLQMKVTTAESGNVFTEPQVPVFEVRLTNISSREQSFQLIGTATHLYGGASSTAAAGTVPAGKTRVVQVSPRPIQRGYHDFQVELNDRAGNLLLRRRTSFALLPRDQRRHRARSPFGTWEWHGKHVTSMDSDLVGSLYQKLGFRYGMSHHTPDSRKRWGTRFAFEPKLDRNLARYETLLAKNPDLPEVALLFHENTLSERHAMRVPDLFTDRAPFRLNRTEEAKYNEMLAFALDAASRLRQRYPDVKISFGNGVPATKEEFYRRGFPAAAFDFAGNEAGCFHRLPETQPPDFIALNASLWMDRQLLDAYGYQDKQVHQSYETCYPGDNPGNLSSTVQADYFVRHALHSLAWGMPFIHIGMLMDVGNSYYHSLWGASGFCRAMPEVNVKPAFVAMATLTRVLDGARFVKAHETTSESLYAMEFARPDGQNALVLWTIRGSRAVHVRHDGPSWLVVTDQGVEVAETSPLLVGSSPIYLVGEGRVRSVVAGVASHEEAPPQGGALVASFGNSKDWIKLQGRSRELEEYNFMTPRKKGHFRLETAQEFNGRGPSLSVHVQPRGSGKDTMPSYERLALKRPVTLPGKPNEIGAWIYGNSGWGRIIYELRDAQGERWVSVGAEVRVDGIPRSGWSTDDPYGLSVINFDGWRYVAFPLPGNYPGERHPWPANSFWRWTGDGVVQYPLRLVGVAITLPEKVLHVRRWEEPSRQDIYLEEVWAGWRATWLE